jgi:hypothetical protein
MVSKPAILAIGAVASYAAAAGTGLLLIQGDVHSIRALAAMYIVYSLSMIVALHCCGFGLPLWFEFRPSKRLPKYLEYAYMVLILVSLLDIINFAPRYYLYLSSKGNEASLLDQIAGMAETQLRDNCGKGPQHSSSGRFNVWVDFPADYCEKLAGLVKGKQQKDAVLKIAKDPDFIGRGRVVTHFVTSVKGEMHLSEFGNPITGLIQRLSVLDTFQKYSDDPAAEAGLKWIAMLLLPIGIGLRALKTSLELFGDFK